MSPVVLTGAATAPICRIALRDFVTGCLANSVTQAAEASVITPDTVATHELASEECAAGEARSGQDIVSRTRLGAQRLSDPGLPQATGHLLPLILELAGASTARFVTEATRGLATYFGASRASRRHSGWLVSWRIGDRGILSVLGRSQVCRASVQS